MNEVLVFFITSIILISWFIVYMYTIFSNYESEQEKELQDTMINIKNPNTFQQLVTGNSVERVVIKGEFSIAAIEKNLDQAQKKLDDLNDTIKQANLSEQIQGLKIKSLELKTNNAQLNKELLDIQKDFDDIVFGSSMVSTRSLFPQAFRYHTKGVRSQNKELLHYLYKNIKDSYNIISDN